MKANFFHCFCICLTAIFISGCAENDIEPKITSPTCGFEFAYLNSSIGSLCEEDGRSRTTFLRFSQPEWTRCTAKLSHITVTKEYMAYGDVCFTEELVLSVQDIIQMADTLEYEDCDLWQSYFSEIRLSFTPVLDNGTEETLSGISIPNPSHEEGIFIYDLGERVIDECEGEREISFRFPGINCFPSPIAYVARTFTALGNADQIRNISDVTVSGDTVRFFVSDEVGANTALQYMIDESFQLVFEDGRSSSPLQNQTSVGRSITGTYEGSLSCPNCCPEMGSSYFIRFSINSQNGNALSGEYYISGDTGFARYRITGVVSDSQSDNLTIETRGILNSSLGDAEGCNWCRENVYILRYNCRSGVVNGTWTDTEMGSCQTLLGSSLLLRKQ